MHAIESAGNNVAITELIKTFRGWKSLDGDSSALDIDRAAWDASLVGYNFSGIEGVDLSLRRIQDFVVEDEEDAEFISALIRSSRSYLHALRSRELNFSLQFDEYCYLINGFKPKRVAEDTIRKHRGKVEDMFKDLDREAGKEGFNQSGWKIFFDKYRLGQEDIKRSFMATKDMMEPFLAEVVNHGILQSDAIPQPQFVNKNVSWVAWYGMNPENPSELLLSINSHRRHEQVWVEGFPEMFCIHEYGGHGAHTANMERLAKLGVISQLHLTTLVPGPGQYHMEGLAINVPFLVPGLYERGLSDFGRFAVEYKYLYWLVYNNALVDINSPAVNKSLREQRQEIQYYLPAESNERVTKEIRSLKTDPWSKGYTPAYTEGNKDFRRIASKLTDNQKIDLLRKLFGSQMTYLQTQALFRSYSV